MREPKIINCGHCRRSRRGAVSKGETPCPDDIIIRLRRAYDETGNSLLRDAMEAITEARRNSVIKGNGR